MDTDSYLDHQRTMRLWAWDEPADRTWPDEMNASLCGDWVDDAIAVLSLLHLPVTIRKVLLKRLLGCAHYCNKWDRVQEYNFGDGDLELVQSLAGPYPAFA